MPINKMGGIQVVTGALLKEKKNPNLKDQILSQVERKDKERTFQRNKEQS